MEDIMQLGEYARTYFGIIRMVVRVITPNESEIGLKENLYHFQRSSGQVDVETSHYTKTHSFDIKDLLEIGDIVGIEMPCAMETSGKLRTLVQIDDKEQLEGYRNDSNIKILSVLTREQREGISFVIRGEK